MFWLSDHHGVSSSVVNFEDTMEKKSHHPLRSVGGSGDEPVESAALGARNDAGEGRCG